MFPPLCFTVLMPPVVFTALIYIFVSGRSESAAAYIIFGLSAYCLTILALRMPALIIGIRDSRTVKRLTGSPLGKKYLDDVSFRVQISILAGMTADLVCAAFRAIVGISYRSEWLIAMAAYCLGLGLLKLSLAVKFNRRSISAEIRCYRRTARLLLLLDIPMGVMIAMTVLTDAGYSYPGYVIYLSAGYTFYTVIHSVVSLVRFRKLGKPVLSAAKALSLVAALMSLLGLQTAMITQFSQESDSFRVLMNTLTGAAVWMAVILIAAYMLRRGKILSMKARRTEAS